MISDETLLNLEMDEPAVRAFTEESGGALGRDSHEKGVYWLTLHPRKEPGETFFIRIEWSEYPQRAPSVMFADAVQGNLKVSSAWPLIPGYRPKTFDICMPFTAEGFRLHPDWSSSSHAWPQSGNPFLWVATRLQDDLNYRYRGRSK